jgi:hypothetical protein
MTSPSIPMRSIIMAGLIAVAAALGPVRQLHATEPVDPAIAKRFEYLSTNGNSNCSSAFLEAIPNMPVTARIQGSCCSPMDLARYAKQTEGLKKYKDIAAIPADPYDIPAGLAQQALSNYDLTLTPAEQKAYDYAMAHSEEKGPCCCQCWRWKVYGGLAKYLIRNHGFTGAQVTEVWDLSNGCGGAA